MGRRKDLASKLKARAASRRGKSDSRSGFTFRDLTHEALEGVGARPSRLFITLAGTVLGIAALVATLGFPKRRPPKSGRVLTCSRPRESLSLRAQLRHVTVPNVPCRPSLGIQSPEFKTWSAWSMLPCTPRFPPQHLSKRCNYSTRPSPQRRRHQ